MRALIVSADQFEDTELLVPLYRLQEAEVEVDVAALRRGPIEGKHGYRVEADRAVNELDAGDYDLLILPGGKAPAALREDEQVLALARAFVEADKPVASICHGAQILISAGLVKGRTATAYEDVQPELAEAGATVKDEPLVVDGNLITSRHPGDLPHFTRAIMERVPARAGA